MATLLTPFPKFRAFDSNGDPLAGGKLYTFEPVTSTPKATYVNSLGVTPNANPVILDASGQANVWLTGLYTFRLDSALDVTQWTVDNVGTPPASADPFSILARDYGNDLVAAVAAIGATKTTLLITAATTVASNLTVPDTLLLVVSRAGLITISGGATLTLTNAPEAGPYTIFAGAGTVTWTTGATVWAEWWGAAPGVDSAVAIKTALNAATQNMHVQINEGTFLIGSKITVPTGIERDWRLVGRGLRTTILQHTTGYAGTILEIGDLTVNNGRYIVEGVGFDGLSAATVGRVGIRVLRAGSGQIRDCLFENLEHGYWQTSGVSNVIRDTRVEDCAYGITLDNGANTPTMFAVQDSSVRNCTIVGILIDGSTNVAGLLRNVQLDRVTIESDAVLTGTDIGLKIRIAQQINVRNCWFESAARFVDIDGGENGRPTAFIKFDTCNFGRQNDAALLNLTPDPITGTVGGLIAFRWAGVGGNDGRGCELTNCDIVSSGPAATVEYQFTTAYPIPIRGTAFLGTSLATGTSWYMDGPSGTESQNYEDLTSKATWRLRRINKNITSPAFIYRGYEFFATGSTSDATPFVLDTYNMPDDSAAVVEALFLGRTANNGTQVAYKRYGLFKDVAGTVTQIGVTASGMTQIGWTEVEAGGFPITIGPILTAMESDTTLDAIIDSSGTAIQLKVTGIVATVRWAVWYNVLQISG